MPLGDGIRYNVAKISRVERERFRDAILALNAKSYPGARGDSPVGGVTYWFKQDEIHQATHVHRGPAFLTWHRELCNRFEALLREVDPQLSLHYWDWTTDPGSLFTSDFMGQPRGTAKDPWLTAGFYNPNAANQRDNTGNPFDPPGALERQVVGGTPNLGISDAQILSAET